MAGDERKTVRIGCRVANGLDICLFKPGYDDGTGSGYRPILPGKRVSLKGPGGLAAGVGDQALQRSQRHDVTDVDAVFWDEWKAQNAGKNQIFDQGLIFEAGVDEKAMGR